MESLALEIGELKGVLSRVREFLNEQLDACSCEHCGQILVRKHILAPYRLDRGSDGKPLPQSFRWFCGYCVKAACVSLGGNQPEIREHIGEWLARGYGREFLAEIGSAHLGPGANHAPVAEHLRREFAAEFETFSAGDLTAGGLPYQAVVLVPCFSWDLGVSKNSPPGSLTQTYFIIHDLGGKLKTFGASARTASGLVNTSRQGRIYCSVRRVWDNRPAKVRDDNTLKWIPLVAATIPLGIGHQLPTRAEASR